MTRAARLLVFTLAPWGCFSGPEARAPHVATWGETERIEGVERTDDEEHAEIVAVAVESHLQSTWIPPAIGRVTSRFADPPDGTLRTLKHDAIDIAVPLGSEVVAPAAMRVTTIGISKDAGRYLMADARDPGDDGEHYRFTFAHLSHVEVFEGDDVERGQLIGLSGISGNVSGPHLHFRVERVVNGQREAVDPLDLLPEDVVTGAVAPQVPPAPRGAPPDDSTADHDASAPDSATQ